VATVRTANQMLAAIADVVHRVLFKMKRSSCLGDRRAGHMAGDLHRDGGLEKAFQLEPSVGFLAMREIRRALERQGAGAGEDAR